MTTQGTPNRSNGAAPAHEWNARAYHTLSEPQFEWGKRVLSTLELDGAERVMDAGCGTGRLTALLAARLDTGRVVAIDRSENMVRVAAETLSPFADRATVALADLCALPFRAAFDVVFSTATFHWVLDHDALYAGIHNILNPRGRLHAQCGGGPNLTRIHGRAHELMTRPEFSESFAGWSDPSYYASVEDTRKRLRRARFEEIDVSLEAAPVRFPDAPSFAAFVSTVVLRPFLARLADDGLRRSFVEQITSAAADDDPPLELDYWRLNIRARRS